MRAPIHAILWEIWRVTREEAAGKLALGAAGGLIVFSFSAAFASPENLAKLADVSAVIALALLVLPHFLGWISPPKLSGGKPGFPLYLLYTRPVRTSVLVGVPLAYLTFVPAAIYLVSALLLRVTFDYPFPLLPVAAWIAILNLVLAANSWSARRMIFVMMGNVVACGIWMVLAHRRLFPDGLAWHRSPKLTWPTIFDASFTDYAVIALIGLAAFGVAVARVARQRRGDAQASVPAFWTPGAGYPEWLVNLFRLTSPTSSATRAQLWFDLKSTGLPVLTIGLAFAILSPLLIWVSGLIDGAIGELLPHLACSMNGCSYARPLAAIFTLAAPLFVLLLGGNAFGIRRKQGRTYLSPFETTQPYGIAQLAALKILVRSACVLAALIAIGASMWTTLSFLSPSDFDKLYEDVVVALTGYQQLALALVVAIAIVVWVAASAVLAALGTRYSRVLNIAALLLLLFVIPLALVAMSKEPQLVNWRGNFLRATSCAAVVPMVFFTVYLFWSGFAERLLTHRYACGAIALSAAFAAAWVTVLHAAGVQFAAMPATYVVSMLSPVLVLLTLSVLVPAALSRIRSPSGWPTNLHGEEPVMNDLELTVALAKAPSLAFEELRNRPRFWLPLLLVVFTSVGLAYWYNSIVDFEWLKETLFSKNSYIQQLPEAEQAARMSGLTRNEKLWSSVISTFIAIPLFSALQAWYFLLAAKITKLPQGFKHWFALSCWCSLPALLASLVSAILLLLADTTQVDRSVLNPLSLNELLFHVRRGTPWYQLLEMLSIPAFLSWALTLIGVRAWSQRSWAFSATMFLLPSALTFGIWALLLSQ
jgi:hypothetical protein